MILCALNRLAPMCVKTCMKITPMHQCYRGLFNHKSLSSHSTKKVLCQTKFQTILNAFHSAMKSTSTDIVIQKQKIVGWWLLGCSAMTLGAIVIGGVTRLTESGLSITKWDPVKGVRYPSSEEDWNQEFDRYKATPEFRYLGRELEMKDFQSIYFMEWFHRIWGRLVGLTFALPAAYFLSRGYISLRLKPRLAVFAALIAAQAFLGVYMVNSGLEEKDWREVPRVSQYRLCAHFGLAAILYSGLLWNGLSHLLQPIPMMHTPALVRLGYMAHFGMTLVFITALSGAFVAGLDAGLVYNTWPKFADRWIPTDLFAHSPTWRNFFENHTTVQFTHRHLGELTGLYLLGLWLWTQKYRLHGRVRCASHATLLAVGLQILLGVHTLLNHVRLDLAISHQFNSIMLLSAVLWFSHELRRLPK